MASADYYETKRSGGAVWILAPVVLILFLGAAMSVGAYFYGEPQLTIAESIAAGFGALAAIIISLIAAVLSIIVAAFGALVALVAAGGAVAVTLFVIGSPIIALILIVLLMRRPKSGCPDPSAH